ncbi:hypothetical protein JK361_10030 [Streptomyces sp. 5-8]|uniref:Secreted protein n=1 Tax=Streptomyces musisoli TaxID=2802280 RepID=A0ABS1NXV6_9ACTN|nr:hypothetical protein [Streptomyces musisoli]MBL1104928.1 hypothetical protein [Streptomyces musisoli]
MDGEVVSGLIGLGGALIGGGVSVWATKVTQRQQAKERLQQAEDERSKLIEQRGREAGEKTLTELYALRRHILRWGPDLDPESRRSWLQTGQELADQAEMTAWLIPQSEEIRTRMGENLTVVIHQMHWDHDHPERTAYHGKVAVTHAIDVMAAFIRRDPLPDPTAEVEQLRIDRAEYELENPQADD